MTFITRHSGHEIAISTRARHVGADLLLFMHGLGCAKDSFDGAFEADALREYSLCSFDFPSHGLSGALPPGVATLQVYADIACDVLDRLSPQRVHLVCHSMGGAVGLLAAPKIANLATFVNVEGNLIGADCGLVSRQIANQPIDQFRDRGFNQLVDELEASNRKDLQTWGTWLSRCDPIGLHDIANSLVEWSDRGELLDMFLRLPNPVYLYGCDSQLDHLFSALQGTLSHSISRSGHFPMIDNPREFYELLQKLK